MLVQAAADIWQVTPGKCEARNGHIIEKGSQRKLSFGNLVNKASTFEPPTEVQLKDSRNFKVLGTAKKRLDTLEKVNGKALFGMDIYLPKMLTAVVARSPVFGAKVKSFDASKANKIAGVRKLVQIDSGIAVLADHFWVKEYRKDVVFRVLRFLHGGEVGPTTKGVEGPPCWLHLWPVIIVIPVWTYVFRRIDFCFAIWIPSVFWLVHKITDKLQMNDGSYPHYPFFYPFVKKVWRKKGGYPIKSRKEVLVATKLTFLILLFETWFNFFK